jgi:hypothetical protein
VILSSFGAFGNPLVLFVSCAFISQGCSWSPWLLQPCLPLGGCHQGGAAEEVGPPPHPPPSPPCDATPPLRPRPLPPRRCDNNERRAPQCKVHPHTRSTSHSLSVCSYHLPPPSSSRLCPSHHRCCRHHHRFLPPLLQPPAPPRPPR